MGGHASLGLLLIAPIIASIFVADPVAACYVVGPEREPPLTRVTIRDLSGNILADFSTLAGKEFTFDGHGLAWVQPPSGLRNEPHGYRFWTPETGVSDLLRFEGAVMPNEYGPAPLVSGAHTYMTGPFAEIGYEDGWLVYETRVDQESLPETTERTALVARNLTTGETIRTPFGTELEVPFNRWGEPSYEDATKISQKLGFIWGLHVVHVAAGEAGRTVSVYSILDREWVLKDVRPIEGHVTYGAIVTDYAPDHLVFAGRYSRPSVDEESRPDREPTYAPPGPWFYHAEDQTFENMSTPQGSFEARIDEGFLYWADLAGTHRRPIEGGPVEDLPHVTRSDLRHLQEGRVFSVEREQGDVIEGTGPFYGGCGEMDTCSSEVRRAPATHRIEVRTMDGDVAANTSGEIGTRYAFMGESIAWTSPRPAPEALDVWVWDVFEGEPVRHSMAGGVMMRFQDAASAASYAERAFADEVPKRYLGNSLEIGYGDGWIVVETRSTESSAGSTTLRTSVIAHNTTTGESRATPFGTTRVALHEEGGGWDVDNATVTFSMLGYVWGTNIVRDAGWGDDRVISVYDAAAAEWILEDVRPTQLGVPDDALVTDYSDGILVFAGRYSHTLAYPEFFRPYDMAAGRAGVWLYNEEDESVEHIAVVGGSFEAKVDEGHIYWADRAGVHRRALEGGATHDLEDMDRETLRRLEHGRLFYVDKERGDIIESDGTAAAACGVTGTTSLTGAPTSTGHTNETGVNNIPGGSSPSPSTVGATLALTAAVVLAWRRRE